jgi:T5SS/PEP-CTERM-associated repeat protein
MTLTPTRVMSLRSPLTSPSFFVAVLAWLSTASPSPAGILTSGDVTPDPNTTTSSSTLYVGNTASGSMTVDGGSVVNSGLSYMGYEAGAVGTVIITGPGSKWDLSSLDVGEDGSGNLTVSNGGIVDASSVSLGSSDTGFGSATITGAGSLVTSSFFRVGDSGAGVLNIAAGGKVSSTFGNVGSSGDGTATIDGTGSSWAMTGSFSMGLGGTGDFTVQNGGLLSTSSASISQSSSSSLTVTGAASVWNNTNAINIGASSSNGVLNISQGATVNSGGDTTLGRTTAATGAINFDNGTLNTGGLLTGLSDLHGTGTINTHGLVTDIDLVFDQSHGMQQQFVFSDGGSQNITVNLDQSSAGSLGAGFRGNGTLRIADGRAVQSRGGVIGYGSTANGMATVDGAGSKWSMSGNLTVGSSGTGVLNIKNGGVVETTATTQIAAAGTSGIAFDNGTLNTKSLLAAASQLAGTGTVNAHGIISDLDIVLDATHPLQQQLIFNSLPNQNVTVNLDIDGTSTMGAGYRGVGSLTIADGKVLNSSLGYLGYGSGSVGTANVNGSGSKWAMTGALTVGQGGDGFLNVTGGGSVMSNGGTINRGKVTIAGTGTVWTTTTLVISRFGFGAPPELVITSGGKVVSSGSGSFPGAPSSTGIGSSGFGVGKVTIEGPSSTWVHSGSLSIGGDGSSLNVTSGGSLTTAGSAIASEFGLGSSPSVTITGAGSTWTNSGSFSIGASSFGSSLSATFTISAGASVSNTTAGIGGGFSSGGKAPIVTVTDAGSKWTTTDLFIGDRQNAVLKITNGGAVFSTRGGIGYDFLASASVSVSGPGSLWDLSNQLAVGGYFIGNIPSPLPGGPGTLAIGNGGAVRSAGDVAILNQSRIDLQSGSLTAGAIRLQNPSSSVFNWTGGTLSVGTYNGNLVNSAGTLAPGSSPGKTTITGNYAQQSAATLAIEIGGTAAGTQFDWLAVNGATTLNGNLNLSMLGGFVPAAADEFTILTSGGPLSGMFSNIASGGRLTTTDGLGSFLVSYSVTSRQVVLSSFQVVPEPGVAMLLALLFFAIALNRRLAPRGK